MLHRHPLATNGEVIAAKRVFGLAEATSEAATIDPALICEPSKAAIAWAIATKLASIGVASSGFPLVGLVGFGKENDFDSPL